jgi:histidyl-tRNA synthetase
VVILGERELAQGAATAKDMATGAVTSVPLGDMLTAAELIAAAMRSVAGGAT